MSQQVEAMQRGHSSCSVIPYFDPLKMHHLDEYIYNMLPPVLKA